MQDAAAAPAKNLNQKNDNGPALRGETSALADCYGEIGISAVRAAARYQGSAKNPAYAPSSTLWRDRLAETAAA